MKDEFVRKVIVVIAKLIFRLNLQGKIYLTNDERVVFEYLKDGDFSALDVEEQK